MTEQMTEQLPEPIGGPAPDGAAGPMVPEPVRIPWATVPRVNLMPIEIIEARRFRRTQAMLGAALLGTVLIAGASTYRASSGVATAKDQLSAAQATVTGLGVQQAKYAAVPKLIAAVAAASTARNTAMSTDMLWYQHLDSLAAALPAGIQITTETATITPVSAAAGASTAAAPGANALAVGGIGTIALSGTAETYPEVSAMIDAVNRIPGLTSAALASATRSGTHIAFALTAVISTDALSGRYQKAG